MTNGRPFHETVVEALKGVVNSEQLTTLGRLLIGTIIPANHDTILEAWVNAVASSRWDYSIPLVGEVLEWIAKERTRSKTAA